MGYHIILCRVDAINLSKQSITMTPLNSSVMGRINTTAATGLRFASTYAPYVSDEDPKTERINNVPVGSVSYPQPGDRVLALVWVTDMSDSSRTTLQLAQNKMMEVIILARVNWNHPQIGPYDHMMADKSGAKIHINHGWMDETNILTTLPDYLEDEEAAKEHQGRTGHVTQVGNRYVQLSGQKFLPFGLFSHLIGQGKKGRDQVVLPESTGSDTPDGAATGTKWKDVFTQDPTEDIFNDLLDKGLGDKKFLEPPCPPIGTKMDMHDSGYKILVGVDGHVREYVPKGKIIIIGQDDTPDKQKKMSFDPEGENEQTYDGGRYADVAEGVLQIEFVSQSKTLTLKFDPTNDIVELTTSSGKFKVTGNIEATLDVKGATGTFG